MIVAGGHDTDKYVRHDEDVARVGTANAVRGRWRVEPTFG